MTMMGDEPEPEDNPDEVCKHMMMCCALDPRCSGCPESCWDIVCDEKDTCSMYEPGKIELMRCSMCESSITEDFPVRAWVVDKKTGEITKMHLVCEACTPTLIGMMDVKI